MTWSEKIRWHRQQLRLSQAELAAAVGLHQSRIARWELGSGMPTMEQGLRLARALRVSYDEFADNEHVEPPPPEGLVQPEEVMVLEMVRMLGLVEAKRRLLAVPAPRPATDYGRVTAEQDLTASTRRRIHAVRRRKRSGSGSGSGDPEPDAKGQDEGTDSAGPPRRRR
jgi:transcriptional regulator with XRE-family HTH domain